MSIREALRAAAAKLLEEGDAPIPESPVAAPEPEPVQAEVAPKKRPRRRKQKKESDGPDQRRPRRRTIPKDVGALDFALRRDPRLPVPILISAERLRTLPFRDMAQALRRAYEGDHSRAERLLPTMKLSGDHAASGLRDTPVGILEDLFAARAKWIGRGTEN